MALDDNEDIMEQPLKGKAISTPTLLRVMQVAKLLFHVFSLIALLRVYIFKVPASHMKRRHVKIQT